MEVKKNLFPWYKWLIHLLVVALLTVLTQVGGLIWLAMLPFFHFINKKKLPRWKGRLLKAGGFFWGYFLASLIIIPPLASLGGRVPLPMGPGNENLKPLNFLTVLANRHYVDEELYAVLENVGSELTADYPEATIHYLDANFPFFDGFPLLPHLSHSDGEKVDLAFYYQDADTQEPLPGGAPAWLGYGAFEAPRGGESDKPTSCQSENSLYDFAGLLNFKYDDDNYVVNEAWTAELIAILAKQDQVGKIFIEPHLKSRWKLSSINKVRFHGCHAVRHDDHIHVELR